MWQSDLKISCRNVTLRSKNTVSECDTPIQEYRVGTWHSDPRIPCVCVGTWHSDPRIPCRNVTLRSNYTINLSFIITAFNSLLYYFHQAFFIQGITSIDRIREYKFYGLRISDQSQNQIIQSHSQVHRELHNIIQGISITFKSLLSNSINHNLPPLMNRSQVSYFSNTFSFLNTSERLQSMQYA